MNEIKRRAEVEIEYSDHAEHARVGEKLLKMKTTKEYRGTEDSKSLYMLASAICLGASPEAISQMAPAILAAFFADLDLSDEVELEHFSNNTPSPTTTHL